MNSTSRVDAAQGAARQSEPLGAAGGFEAGDLRGEVADAKLVTGNAARDDVAVRGWFVGHFISPEHALRSTHDVEVKWGTHALGEERPEWGSSDVATTLSVLVRGCIRLAFEDGGEALLHEPGDYALWAPGFAHRWTIEQDDTVVLTVRWPSGT